MHKPRTLWKGLEEMISRCMSMVYLPHSRYLDIRIGLFIISIDYVLVV